MKIDYKMMSKHIKARRKELTEKAGLNDKYISNIERATSIPSINTLLNICKVLDISIDFVLNDFMYKDIETSTIHMIINKLKLMEQEEQ